MVLMQWLRGAWARMRTQLPPATADVAPAVDDRLPTFVAHVVREMEKTPHAGAQKRAWTFSVLRSRFPERQASDLNLAIELAIRDMKREIGSQTAQESER